MGEQLRARFKLLFNIKVGAARPLAGWSRFIINLLSQGCPSFKSVPMFKGPRKAGSSRVRPLGKVFTLLALGGAPTWSSFAKMCTQAHC